MKVELNLKSFKCKMCLFIIFFRIFADDCHGIHYTVIQWWQIDILL